MSSVQIEIIPDGVSIPADGVAPLPSPHSGKLMPLTYTELPTKMNDDEAGAVILGKLGLANELLKECNGIEEAMQVRGFAIVTFNWVEQLRLSEEAKYQAEELRLKAEVKAGKCLKEMDKNEGGEWTHKDKSSSTTPVQGEVKQDVSQPPTIKQLGITHNQSSNYQAIANLDDDEINEIVQKAKEEHKPVPAAYTIANQQRKKDSVAEREAKGLKPVRPEFWWTEDYINGWKEDAKSLDRTFSDHLQKCLEQYWTMKDK